MSIQTMDELKTANRNIGHFWFSPDTLRFFRSRVSNEIINGRYFISSEQFNSQSPRLFTIRQFNERGSISTVGEFQKYKSLYLAKKAAKELEGVEA